MGARARFTSNERVQPGSPGAVPLLDARAGGPAERFARRLGGHHPAGVFFAAILAGFAILGLIGIALGLLLTDVLLHAGGIARADNSAVTSLVADRTPSLTDASEVGSALGGAPFLPILVGAIALGCALLRKWRIAAFALFALAVESATYRVTSLAVPRERPAVRRLDDLPANDSFPSGHTAASVAVYVGLAPAHHVPLPQPRRAARRVGRRDPRPGLRRPRPHLPRDAPPARRRRRAPHRHRGIAGSVVRVFARPESRKRHEAHTGRGSPRRGAPNRRA